MIGANEHGRTFKVKVSEVLESLKKGRKEHKEIVVEAQEAFRKRHIEELERMLQDARDGVRRDMHVSLEVPTSHLNAYDNAITILEMTQSWMHQFAVTNSAYSDKAKKYLDDADGDF